MKVYNKNDVDVTFSNWFMDLEQLTSFDAMPISEGATNGDMIKAMFPSVEVKEKNNGYEVYFGIGTATQYFNHQWWNAPYKGAEE